MQERSAEAEIVSGGSSEWQGRIWTWSCPRRAATVGTWARPGLVRPGASVFSRLLRPVKLPNHSAARVELQKVRDYLLSESHPVGRRKAALFLRLGFDRDRPGELISGLLQIARSEEVLDRIFTPHGTKYVVDGRIKGPEGEAAIRTVWILPRRSVAPRLITAYPVSRETP